MRRPLNIARQWKLTVAILLGLAACGVVVGVLLGSPGNGHAARSRDLVHAVFSKPHAAAPKVKARSVKRRSRTTHRPHRVHAVHRQAHSSSATLIGVGNVLGCLGGSTSGLPILRTYHASVLRVVIQPPYGEDGQALPCIRAARAAGAKINIAIGYNNLWSTSTDVAYFRRVLGYYAPYAWAISVGNEQEVSAGKGASASPTHYAAVWRAVEPVVAGLAPGAIRVAGEISPWGFSFLRSAYASGLPGAQAIAVHPYAAKFGFNFAHVRAWSRTTHLALWATEGLNGPQAWSKADLHAVPLSQLAGVSVAGAWVVQ